MIGIRPYEDHGAMAVFSRLDPHDLAEAQIVRGEAATHLGLFADWRAMRAAWIASHVLTTRATGGQPFAVLAVSHTGQAGVAQAAFLSRDHQRFRSSIARAGAVIRHQLPGWARERGIRRIEARCWLGHPTAPDFLFALGFAPEAIMHGFGPEGRDDFLQYAYITGPNPERTASCA